MSEGERGREVGGRHGARGGPRAFFISSGKSAYILLIFAVSILPAAKSARSSASVYSICGLASSALISSMAFRTTAGFMSDTHRLPMGAAARARSTDVRSALCMAALRGVNLCPNLVPTQCPRHVAWQAHAARRRRGVPAARPSSGKWLTRSSVALR